MTFFEAVIGVYVISAVVITIGFWREWRAMKKRHKQEWDEMTARHKREWDEMTERHQKALAEAKRLAKVETNGRNP